MTLFEIDPLSSVLIAAVVTIIDDTQNLFRNDQTPDYNIPVHVSIKEHLFYFTNYLTKVPLNPPTVVSSNAVTDAAYIYCRMCRNNYPSESFANPASNSLYATCSDCRSLQHDRRFPTVFETITNQGLSDIIGNISNF